MPIRPAEIAHRLGTSLHGLLSRGECREILREVEGLGFGTTSFPKAYRSDCPACTARRMPAPRFDPCTLPLCPGETGAFRSMTPRGRSLRRCGRGSAAALNLTLTLTLTPTLILPRTLILTLTLIGRLRGFVPPQLVLESDPGGELPGGIWEPRGLHTHF